MKLFKKNEEPAAPEETAAAPVNGSGKGRPTPKRRDAEARGLHPVVPTDRKAAKREARAKQDEAWERQRRAMATGDERYLPARDKGPVKRYIRDYIDARYSIGELFLPLSIALIIIFMFISRSSPQTALVLMLSLYGIFFLAIADAIVCWLLLRRKLVAKFGQATMSGQGMIFWYIFTRCFNMRRWRQPAPQVARRQYPS